jgi:membrane protein
MDVLPLLKDAYAGWTKHQVSKLGASLAYYAILSLAPLVIVVISIAAFVFGSEAARQELLTQVQGLVGPSGAEMIGTMISNAQKPATGIVATVLGMVMLLFGASGVFTELHDSLNKIWEADQQPSHGFWGVIRERFVSFGMVLGIGFLLLVSLLLSTGLAAIGKIMSQSLPLPAFGLQAANLVLSLFVITLLFAAIYRFLPSERLPWNDLWIGSFVTAILFVMGKYLVGVYLGRASVGSAYGAAGSLVVLLVWIYYAAQLFFGGAEFTRAYARKHGSIGKREPTAKEAGKKGTTLTAVETSNSQAIVEAVPRVGSSGLSSARHLAKPTRAFQSPVVILLMAFVGFGWWRGRRGL